MAKTSVKEFKLVDVDLLVPYANNARTHSKEQIKKLQSSLFKLINQIINLGGCNSKGSKC